MSQSREVNICLCNFTEAIARCCSIHTPAVCRANILYALSHWQHTLPLLLKEKLNEGQWFLCQHSWTNPVHNGWFYLDSTRRGRISACQKMGRHSQGTPRALLGYWNKHTSSRNGLILQFQGPLLLFRLSSLKTPQRVRLLWGTCLIKAAKWVMRDRSLTSPNDVRLEADTTASVMKSL